MPHKNGSNLLVILDNLEEFAEKLLSQIVDESDNGRKQLVSRIQQAQANYNKPIQAHISGWVYYFSRTRGPDITLAIDQIAALPDVVVNLKKLTQLISEGKWNEGSFNHFLFLELIKGVPGYEPLDAKSIDPVITRLQQLIILKIESYIAQIETNRKLIESREKERQSTQQSAQKTVDHVLLTSDLIAAQIAAKTQPQKEQFCLTLSSSQWQLSWVDPTGTNHPLNLNDELLAFLENQRIVNVDKLNPVQTKRLKKECIKIRDTFFEKTQLLINPKDARKSTDLSNKDLIDNGTTSSFVLRGLTDNYSLYWINSLGKIKEISLDDYPQLKLWLSQQKIWDEQNIPQFKAYLSQINMSRPIGMDDFKHKLEGCLGHKKVSPDHALRVNTSNRLDMSLFKALEKTIGRQAGKLNGQSSDTAEDIVSGTKAERVSPAKLKMGQYTLIESFFGHQAKPVDGADNVPQAPAL